MVTLPKIINGGTPRSFLGEGRTHGIGSMFCKKTRTNEYTLLGGITTCKDYLHDILAAERLGVKVNIYGFEYSKQNPFKGKFAYLAIAMLSSNTNSPSSEIKNWGKIPEFINYFEKSLKFDDLSSISATIDPLIYLLRVPIKWIETTYLISFLTLLVRVGYFWAGQQLSVVDYVKGSISKQYINGESGGDIGQLKVVWPKFLVFLDRGLPNENYKIREYSLGTGAGWHNNGIYNLDLASKWLIWEK